MDLIKAWLHVLLRELLDNKGKVAVTFGILTLLIVLTGVVWPKQYEVSSIIFADDQNIIRPLLSGSAEVTRMDSVSQIAVVRDRIYSPTILTEALVEAEFVKKGVEPETLEPLMRQVRSVLKVSDIGRGHLRISYQGVEPEKVFALVSAVTNVYIRDSSAAKRRESREAFTFIDNQVRIYKDQLQAAEDRLKKFKSGRGIVAGTSDSRLTQVRADISRLTLDLQIARARRQELRSQLSQENQFAARQFKSDGFRDRLAQAQSQLDTLRLSYNETYPDIVSLKQQIQDLRRAIADAENSAVSEPSSGSVNPVYARLRGDLSTAEVEVTTLELRLAAAQKQLGEENTYSKLSAEQEAQLAEMTRDYTVTQQLYEDMLQRKERARLSVALDVEGQGVTYRIKEPPIFPTVPVGIRFMHFFLLAPVVGLAVPLGLLAAYIQFDPRIRFVDRLAHSLPESVPVIAVIPHMGTPVERHTLRSELSYIALLISAVLLIYIVVGLLRLLRVL